MSFITVSPSMGKQPLFLLSSPDNQFLFNRCGFPRISVQEPGRKPDSLKQTTTKVSCSIGHDNLIATNMSSKESVLKQARLQFSEEISFRNRDEDVSPVKALLLVSAEDEAFMSLNREKDRLAACTEGRNISIPRGEPFEPNVHGFPIAGRTMSMWLSSFDFLVKEVQDFLALKGGSTRPVDILKAVNTVLFDIQKFKRTVTDVDTKSYYIHMVMTLGTGSVLLLSIIYMEVCRRLGIKVGAAQFGEELLMWPLVDNVQEFFETSSTSKNWFSELLAFQHQSHLSSTVALLQCKDAFNDTKFVTNRDIIAMTLSYLKDLHWKDACKARPGFALTDALHKPVNENDNADSPTELAVGALLRPRNLKLALMASERLLLIHPHNWVLRRDHGLLLYHSRRYGEAVQELSICTAFAPTVEAEMLEHLVEKLHLLRIESSWTTAIRPTNAPSPLA